MPGVRLHHPTVRNTILTVEHPRPYRLPFLCPSCREVHLRKTYHFWMNADGDVLVSETILQRLREVPDLAGLTVANEVKDPPSQTIGHGVAPESRPRIHLPLGALVEVP